MDHSPHSLIFPDCSSLIAMTHSAIPILVIFHVRLGSSFCGGIENDPKKPDNRSSVVSELDLLNNCNKDSTFRKQEVITSHLKNRKSKRNKDLNPYAKLEDG